MDLSSQEAASPTLSSLPASSEPSHRSPVIFLPLHKAILLNISKKYSLTPSLFIYKNQLNTLLLCSIWIREQPGLYLAEIPLPSPQIPAEPQLQGRRGWEGGGAGGLQGCSPRDESVFFTLSRDPKCRLGQPASHCYPTQMSSRKRGAGQRAVGVERPSPNQYPGSGAQKVSICVGVLGSSSNSSSHLVPFSS